jgi:ABC-type Mn2+/Zn2+ transport system ATPase subunit
MTRDPLVRMEGLTLRYGGRSVLRHVDLEVPAGSFLGLIGPNGCGKTTLLRAILGLLRPASGAIRYRADRVPRVGYIQQRQLFDDFFPLTVEEIVLMGRVPLVGVVRRFRPVDRAAAYSAMETTGIAPLAGRLFRELSGGQKQRCLLARALAAEPELLALDEPTSEMDIASEQATLQLISRIRRERSLTIVMVSHRLDVVINFVDRLAVLRDGELRSGATDAMLSPELLREYLGIPVVIGRIAGRRIIVPAEAAEPTPPA